MRSTLMVHKDWETIEAGSTDSEKNDMATAFLLFQSIPEALVLQVGELDTTKKVWEGIKVRHVGVERVKEARLQTLMAEFDRLKMKDSKKIDDFAGKLSTISSKLATLRVNIEKPKLVKKFLKRLPQKKYIQIVASLEQVLDLNTTSFEDIIRRLKVGNSLNSQDSAGLATSSSAAFVPVVSVDLNERGEVNSSNRGASDGKMDYMNAYSAGRNARTEEDMYEDQKRDS
ncbi:hypothetical protein ISN44_As11g029780 [Arabidopsis suecica]|uniref:Uncharacterized protein n=1 Tax=Arabidopsis suecica TaxID=45249 RepID=A0A8T1ZFB9_ARASU|nr:hypothetical protein ISN44_As11g029780 [Arabidopsis suecica]